MILTTLTRGYLFTTAVTIWGLLDKILITIETIFKVFIYFIALQTTTVI